MKDHRINQWAFCGWISNALAVNIFGWKHRVDGSRCNHVCEWEAMKWLPNDDDLTSFYWFNFSRCSPIFKVYCAGYPIISQFHSDSCEYKTNKFYLVWKFYNCGQILIISNQLFGAIIIVIIITLLYSVHTHTKEN